MKKIIITAGGTSEKIDNVRKITNSSTGKLGSEIAAKLIELQDKNIEKIYYVCSKNAIKPLGEKIEIVEIFDTADLQFVINKLLTENNISCFIHSMAVSDYTVDYVTTAENLAENIDYNNADVLKTICNFNGGIIDNKISSNYDNLILKLKRTPKIISTIKDISPSTYLVGFKLLDSVGESELINTACELKEKNKCDLVVANDLKNIKNGNHKAFIVRSKNDYVNAYGKEDIAIKLVKEIIKCG